MTAQSATAGRTRIRRRLRRGLALALAALALPGSVAAPAAASDWRADADARRAAAYFDAVRAVEADPARAFLTPEETRYVRGVSGETVDILILWLDGGRLVSRAVARVGIERLAFSGAGCWTARQAIDLKPGLRDVIRQTRADDKRILRAVRAGGPSPFARLPHVCAGGRCAYTTRSLPQSDTGGDVCLDPGLLSDYADATEGIPAVLSAGTEIPCSERRGEGVEDGLCQQEQDLVSYTLAWDRGFEPPAEIPLHCDHKKATEDGVCAGLEVEPAARIGTVVDLAVDRSSSPARLTGKVRFANDGIASKLYELIDSGRYQGCGSVGISYERDDVEFYTEGSERRARVVDLNLDEFSLVQVGQDPEAGILKLEHQIARNAGVPAVTLNKAGGDPFTIGRIARARPKTAFCRGGVLTDPRTAAADDGETP